MPARPELVVIVILTRDDRERTLRCLASVAAQDHTPLEVVVVDNGSRDGTLAAVAEKFPDSHCVRSDTNLGVAGGRNLGLARARQLFPGAPLYFLDNDAWLAPDTLGELVRVMAADPSAALVGSKILRPWSPVVIAAIGGHHINWYTGTFRSVGAGEVDVGQYDRHEPITCNGGSVLVRPEVFDAVGGFDDVFNPYGWEDIDFALRARKAGFAIRLAPRAVIYHEGGRAGRGRALPEYERSKTRGYFVLMRRHSTRVQWICCLCLLPLRALGRALLDLGRGEWRVPLAHARGAFAAAAGRVSGAPAPGAENRVGKPA